MKRVFDILIAIVALATLLGPFAIIAIVLKMTGIHKVWFLQERIGLHGRHFKVFKFVTMRADAEYTGTKDITIRNDPRVLPVGRLLRKTKFNELPQFINVLVGDMSMVGWRPLMPVSFAMYEPHLQEGIAQVKPGITGLGAIVFRDEEAIISEAAEQGKDLRQVYTDDIMPYKGRLEVWYAEHLSIWLDFKIIIATVFVVLRPGNVYYRRWFRGLPQPTSELVRRHVLGTDGMIPTGEPPAAESDEKSDPTTDRPEICD